MTISQIEVCGYPIEKDESGVGHSWRAATADSLPAHIAEEIAAEIIDGKKESCDDYRASNGQHYRW